MPYYRGQAVSDEYLQGLIRSWRQGAIDGGAVNIEDGDQPIINDLLGRDISTNGDAYHLGYDEGQRQQAELSTGTINVEPTLGWSAGVPIPPDVSPDPARDDAALYATYQRSAGLGPSSSTSGPPGPLGYASFPSASGYLTSGGSGSNVSIGGLDIMTIAVLGGMAIAGWYLLRGE